jgi:uncharacterized protein YbjT (DUF2867 family)
VHVAGAEKIAAVSAQTGVPRFVHVSHLNASASSPSKFYQTKALGEERVKAAFPTATIVRPGAMYGFEDKLLNEIASASLGFSAAVLTNLMPSVAPVVEIKPRQDADTPCPRNLIYCSGTRI